MRSATLAIDYTRPAIINAYAKQRAFIDDKTRYKVIEATTKAGKTVGCIVELFEAAIQGQDGWHYWWVAPTYSQAEIAYKRMKRFISHPELFDSNETKLIIKLWNGVIIQFKTADKPDNLYGEDVYKAIFDEYTRGKHAAWIALRTTLTATGGGCTFIGNVKGARGWGYKLARDAEAGKKNWSYYKITADDAVKAGTFDQEELEDARASFPNKVFLELYYGIPNENSADKFCYSFEEAKHVGSCSLNPMYPVYLAFDFNYNPICCTVFQHYEKTIFAIEVIKLENSNIYNICDVIKTKYPTSMFFVTGDASGYAQSALTKGKIEYYKIIMAELRVGRNLVKVPRANPRLEANQILVNGILEHYKVQIDPTNAAPLIFDCKFVRMSNERKIIKDDRSDPTQQADVLDTFRYYLNQFHSKFVKLPQAS